MIDANEIAGALKLPCLSSGRMQEALELWESMYRDEADWVKQRIRSLKLPSIVAKELKRLTLKELNASVSDAELDAAFQKFLPLLRRQLDHGLAMGGLLLKPYWTQTGIHVDLVPQNQYLPISFTDDTCDAAACPETMTIGSTSYTRVEIHTYDRVKQTHMIENRCFRSDNPAFLGRECSLQEVPAWAGMLPKKVFHNVKQPLFSVFQVPDANSIDPDSPLGVSVFADAVPFIRDADQQWERILWELESSERAIDASEDFFRFNPDTKKPELPHGRERMYRVFNTNPNKNDQIFSTFSPEIRDVSCFNAFNQMLRRIESASGLAYGTLSEVNDTDKTAEEIKASKQRSYDRVHDIQENLRAAVEGAVYGMQYLRDYYENRRGGECTLTCTFGDGILEDTDKEFARRMQMVTAGLLSKEELLKWYFSCDAGTAQAMMPKSDALFGGGTPDADTLRV
ncbi:MAG: phage capsid protein [Ruminococcus sp.]|nr:phage capsid protein [Ruminococcus sp.]